MNTYLGYFFTVLNYVFYCTSRFRSSKKKMLAGDLFAKLSTVIALYLLGSLSGSYSMLVSFSIIILANLKAKKQARWAGLYVLLEALLIFIMIWHFEGISSILVFCTTSISLLSVWWLPPQKMRIAGLTTSFTSLLYQLSIRNFAGLLEIVVITSNILSFIKYQKKKREGI